MSITLQTVYISTHGLIAPSSSWRMCDTAVNKSSHRHTRVLRRVRNEQVIRHYRDIWRQKTTSCPIKRQHLRNVSTIETFKCPYNSVSVRAKLGASELRNPWTDFHQIWRGWFHRHCSRTPDFKAIAPLWASRQPLELSHFYSAPQCSHCRRCASYSNSVRPSVCPSVCLSHAGIVSKRLHVARCSLHCEIAQCV